jgi:hypothetical protein
MLQQYVSRQYSPDIFVIGHLGRHEKRNAAFVLLAFDTCCRFSERNSTKTCNATQTNALSVPVKAKQA